MKRGHRFLVSTLGNLAATSAGGRLLARREARRPDPEAGESLGSSRGQARTIKGPRGASLYTETFPAEGDARGTIVFTHGWCLTEAAWHYQKRVMAASGRNLVTWDLPGHGHSTPVEPSHLSLDLATESLARVVEELASDGPVVVVGHSLGGVVTLRYLAGYPGSERIKGAVLVSTPVMHFAHSVAGRWPGARVEARALGAVMRRMVESPLAERVLAGDVGKDEISRLSYRVARVGFGRQPSATQVRFVRDMIASVPPGVRADTYRTMTGYDLRPLLKEVKVPTLVVIGSRDRLVNPEESLMLATRLPRGRSLVMEDVGHAAFLEAHERFNAELGRFADRRFGPRGRGSA